MNTQQITHYSPPPVLEGYVYSYKEAAHSRDNNQILTIRLETSHICNLKCTYCCNQSGQEKKDELSYPKLESIVLEAKSLGAKSIIVIGGGEPTIYGHFRELISFIDKQNLIPVVFTNTQSMTLDLANFLFDNNTSVIVKLDSINEQIQDDMVGVKGAYRKIREGIQNLFSAGYGEFIGEGVLKLGASFVVNKKNYNDIINVWKFCRSHNFFPNLEMMVPNGNAKDLFQYMLTAQEWNNLKKTILEIDQTEYGYSWFPYTPIIGASCFQVMYNLYITVLGDIRPCASIHCTSVSIKDYTLKQVLELPFFKVARNIEHNLGGKCQQCEHHEKCIGCRGLAFSINNNIKNEIDRLCSEDPSCLYKEMTI